MSDDDGSGRPRFPLTKEQRHEALTLIRLSGVPPHAAFGKHGVNRSTFALWMKRAKAYRDKPNEHPKWVDDALLLDDIEQALATCQCDLALEYRTDKSPIKDVKPNRNAALTILERRFGADWSQTAKHELSGPDGGPIEETVTKKYGLVILPEKKPKT